MNIAIFDTETTSLDKPFCYNIGYIIATDKGETLLKRDYVVEQIWHNFPLFCSAYYADKRATYVSRMKARSVIMDKFGYICQQIRRDFKGYGVTEAYAYNSDFDERVFAFNTDWYKCANPFDELNIYDIRGYVHQFLINNDFIAFCEKYERFTESGNYSTTAETVYQFISDNTDFEEEHTALSDSEIEAQILFTAIANGAEYGKTYPIKRSIEREIEKELHIKTAEQTDYYFKYNKIRINKNRTEITLK